MAKKKSRERTMLNVICWGMTVTFIVSVAELIGMLVTPNTVLWHFWGMYTVGPQLSPGSPLYQEWESELGVDEALLWTPLAVFIGGLTVGVLAPSRIKLLGRAVAAAKTCFWFLFSSIVFVWLIELISLNFKIRAGMITAQFVLAQVACLIGWTLVAAAGGALGGYLRSLRTKTSDSQPLPKTAATN